MDARKARFIYPVTFEQLNKEFESNEVPLNCIGLATSKTKRCQTRPAYTDGLAAANLRLVSGYSVDRLTQIAALCLCKIVPHQKQANDFAKRWFAEIQLNKHQQVDRARDQSASAPISSTSTPTNFPTRSSDSTPIRSRTSSPSTTPAGSPVSTPSTPARSITSSPSTPAHSAASTPSTTPGNSPLHFTTSRSDSAKLSSLGVQLQSAQKSIATLLDQNDEQFDQLRVCSDQKKEVLSENKVLKRKLEASEIATTKQRQALEAELSNLKTAESEVLESAHQKFEKVKEQNAKLDKDLEKHKFDLTVVKQLSDSCQVLMRHSIEVWKEKKRECKSSTTISRTSEISMLN